MLRLRTLRFALLITTLAMVVNMALSNVTFAGHERGRFNGRKTERFIKRHDDHDGRWVRRRRFNDKKAEKFINGHDARDGRWDGRGPRPRFFERRGFRRRLRH
ncbi:MAG: hypothetical protein J2P52_15570 [Blastocatellia bacterium]|nr:hypothetical protein [Blastocatellia bacterium]